MARWLEALSDNISVDKSRCTFCAECVDKCILDNLRFRASPCREACPLRINCQGYVQMTARGQEEKALRTIYEAVPFPGILGRVCASPCEAACSRREVDGEAVAIRALKRYLADAAFPQAGQGWGEGQLRDDLAALWKPAFDLPERVVVIGGGPAGIMAACCLRRQGYRVALYDARARLGGMLTNCIPEFRLPERVVAREVSLLERVGIEIHLGVWVDAGGLKELRNDYDAVVIATGAARGKRLGIPGEELPGVYNGVEFLGAVRSMRRVGTGQPDLGRRVVVIGGGNTAIDAAQAAYRLGAQEVRVVCLESREEMPAFPWEVRDALEEGILIENGWGPARILSTDGRISGVECKRCLSVFDVDGRFAPRYLEEERRVLSADTVIVAIGQEADLDFAEIAGIEVRGGRIVADGVSLQTNVPEVFAAGDAVTGPSSVVQAMAQGRVAAESVHRFLRGMPLHYGRKDVVSVHIDAEVDTSGAIVRPRVDVPRLAVRARRSFAEIEGTLRREQAVAEAERCLSCGEPFGKHRTCWSCLACEVECPEDAISVAVPYLMR